MNKMIRNRLIEVRKAYGLSGYAFAKKLNIPQPTYLRYETGEQKLSGKLIEALVVHCNVNAYWLFTGEGNMFIDPENNSWNRQNDILIEEKLLSFGKRLSLLQAHHNFLDREMAKLLKISEKSYLSLIVGNTKPDIDVLNQIKRNFKISIDYLLYGDDSIDDENC